jgi:hypothetical protein
MAEQTAAEKRDLILLRQAELQLEQIEEETIERAAQKAHKKRNVALVQATINDNVRQWRRTAAICRHKQGGQNGKVLEGKSNATALKVEKYPDGSYLIRCLSCPLRVMSPFPPDGMKKLREGETVKQRDTRLAKYEAAKVRFVELFKESQESALSSEAAQPLVCGADWQFFDSEGTQIYKPRPTDADPRYAPEIAA